VDVGNGLCGITGGEKISEVCSECVCQLVRCSGIGTIWILQATDLVFSISLDDTTVEKISVPVPFNYPSFFDVPDMIGFFLGYNGLVLIMEVLLQGVVLEGWVKLLLVQELVFYLRKEIIVFWSFPRHCLRSTTRNLVFCEKSLDEDRCQLLCAIS
jgi:hypothetical protein